MSNDTTVWFHSMDDLRNRFDRSGNHFFDKTTLKFFNSKISDDLYGGRVFVTGEKRDDEPRYWTVRIAEVLEGGNYSVVALGFQAHGNSAQAHRVAAEVGALAKTGLLPDVFEYGQDVALAHWFGIDNNNHSDDGWIFDGRSGFQKS
jgi:hypothetical protein